MTNKLNNTNLTKVLYDLNLLNALDAIEEDDYWQDVFYDTLFSYYSSYADIVIEDIHTLLLDDKAHSTIEHLLLLVSILESEDAESSLKLLYSMLKSLDLDDSTKSVKNIMTLSKILPDITDIFLDYVLLDDLIVECVLEGYNKLELRYCNRSKDSEGKEDAHECM